MSENKKLYRLEKKDGAKLAGVSGGIAEYFNVDATLIRLLTVILCLCASIGLWVYIAAALILPKKSDVIPPEA